MRLGETIRFFLKILMRELWLDSGLKFVDERIYVTAMKVVGKIGEERDAVVEATRDLLMFLEKELVGKDFFGGRSLGFVDIVATLVAFWLMRTEEIVGVKV
ncbi:unnamed protein product, partial [Arabidopsis halleri]